MRTTVEIRDDQRVALAAIAAKRGIRGYSGLVQEAIDLYLSQSEEGDIEAVLALRGILTDEEAETMRTKIAEAWATWRTPT